MTACLLGIGSNQGKTRHNLDRAVHEIAEWPQAQRVTVSPWRETAAVGGPGSQPAFLNGALLLETEASPQEVLAQLLQIERTLGRQRRQHWGPRTVDLDLLLHGRSVLHQPGLIVPHPWMTVRKFVAQPAADVAPDMVHPQLGWNLARLWHFLRDTRPLITVAGIRSASQRCCLRSVADQTAARLVTHPTSEETAVLNADEAVEFAKELQRHAMQCWYAAGENEIVLCDFWWEEPLLLHPSLHVPDSATAEIVVVLTDDDDRTGEPVLPNRGPLLQRAARPGRGPYVPIPSNRLTQLEHDLTAVIDGLR